MKRKQGVEDSYYNKLKEKIKKFETINDVINFAKLHYINFKREHRAKIFNESILDRQFCLGKFGFSLRLSIDLSYIFISYKPKFRSRFSEYKFNLEKEKEIFICIVEKIYKLDWSKQVCISNFGEHDHRRYFNYKYDYPSIHAYEYFELFKYFDELSEDIYGVSIYRNFSKLIFLLEPTQYLYIKNMTFKKEFNNVKNLFLDCNSIKESSFIEDDLRKMFSGKLGIKFSDGLYVPRAYHILENIFRGIIENDKSNKEKGDILEIYSKDIIRKFFRNIYHTSYDNKGNEQDLIIEFEDKILFVECKAQNFKSIFVEGKNADQIREEHFKEVIVKGCKQCQRGKEYLLNNKTAIYYDSNSKKVRKKTLELNRINNKKVFKIVVILDDYLDLAELSNRYLEDEHRDTWVVNIFALHRILWTSNRIKGMETFFDYLEYRTQNNLGIESLHCDELAQFGYWISPNYSIYPKLDMNINIILRNSFTNIFNEYDYYCKEELQKGLQIYI